MHGHTYAGSDTVGRVLVGGPIQHGLRGGRFDAGLRRGLLTLIDAVRAEGWQVLSAHEAEDFGMAEGQFTPDVVTKRDFEWVACSDIYIAAMPSDPTGRPIVSGGTCVELGWASARRIPVIVIWDEENAERYSHLVRGLHVTGSVSYLDYDGCQQDPRTLLTEMSTLRERSRSAL